MKAVVTYGGLIGGRFGAALLQALSMVLLARWAGPADFGLAVAVQSVILLVSAIAGMGLGPYVTRELAAGLAADEVRRVVRLNSLIGVILGAGLLAVFLALAPLDPRFWLMVPFALGAVAQRNSAVWQGITLARGRTRVFGLSLTLRRAVLLAVFVLMYALGVNPVLSYAVAYVVAEAGVNATLRAITPVGGSASNASMSRLLTLRLARPYWIETIATQLRNQDVAVVAFAAGPGAAGLFAVPSRVSSPATMVGSAVSAVLLPKFASRGWSWFRRGLLLQLVTLAATGLGLVVIVALAGWLVPVIVGDEYLGAVQPLRIYCVGVFFLTFSMMAGAAIQGLGSARVVGHVAAVAATLVLGSVALGAILGAAVGAAVGYSAACFLQAVALVVLLVRLKARS
ncbi:lipopolysaccharide biosynthesis protein [Microbacterium chocolatum]|uniref:lipopolysaccharide biosynthesis protein n=1 Tax=Microbacterium aurantiacum TaxID=162393 RepID=UPI0033904247